MTAMRMEGKTALVSGSGRGIGRAVALALAAEGANVVVNDLDADPAGEVVDAIRALGGSAASCVGSVADADFAERFVATAVDTFGGLDVIVNNAGYTWDSVIQKTTDEQWDAIIDVHLKAPFRILRAAQPIISRLAKAEVSSGVTRNRKVVNVSSISGVFGNAGQANYSSAKAGIIGLTKALSKEWGRYNVNVNAVAFGYIETRLTSAAANENQEISVGGRDIRIGISPALKERLSESIPLGRPGTPQEAAGAILLLTFPEADYISGHTLLVGGGFEG